MREEAYTSIGRHVDTGAHRHASMNHTCTLTYTHAHTPQIQNFCLEKSLISAHGQLDSGFKSQQGIPGSSHI